jgi:hypothetical protein
MTGLPPPPEERSTPELPLDEPPAGPSPGGFEDWQRVVREPSAVAPAAPKRPGIVTAAGVLMIVFGVFATLAGVLLLGSGNMLGSIQGVDTDLEGTFGAIILASGILELLVGILILRLHPAGRIGGVVLGTLGLVFALLQLGSLQGVASLAANAFVVYALVSSREAFARR